MLSLHIKYLAIRIRERDKDKDKDKEREKERHGHKRSKYLPGGGPARVGMTLTNIDPNLTMKSVIKKIRKALDLQYPHSRKWKSSVQIVTPLSNDDYKITYKKWLDCATELIKKENKIFAYCADGKLAVNYILTRKAKKIDL